MAAFALRTVAVAALLLLALPAHAWWDKGHMCVAEIARRNLKADTVVKVQACANALNQLGPYPQSTNIVELGPWADDLKSLGLTTMATWHFVDTVYNPQNVTLTINPIDTVNVANVIPMLMSAIKSPAATSDSIITSVANLIHYVGDIHMPLHSADLFSPEYPLGDLGGNKQTVVVDPATNASMKLHAFWDSMCEGPQSNPVRPLNTTGYAALSAFVDSLLSNFSFTEAQMTTTNASVMAAESYEMATKYVYPGVAHGTVLSDAYKANCRILASGRVALAGYRLATVLNTALAGVSMNAILNGTKRVEAEVEVTHTGDTHNYYAFSGVESGAAAGIFISSFAVGCLLAAAVVLAICACRRRNSSDVDKSAAAAGQRSV